MKKLILTIFAVCAIAFSANAQMYISGSAGIELIAGKGATSFYGHIDPGFGYYFGKHSSAGLYLTLGGGSVGFEWSINPYYRYTFDSSNKLHFFTEGTVNVGQIAGVINWGVGLVPGLTYILNDKINVFSRLGYLGITGGASSTAFRFSALSSCSVGIEYKF